MSANEFEEISRPTIADTLFFLEDPIRRRELEDFRRDYEACYGPTDLTKRYTSTWPLNQQATLRNIAPLRYFEGLPPFAQAYILQLLENRAQAGNLDDVPGDLLSLFISGQLSSRNNTSKGRQ